MIYNNLENPSDLIVKCCIKVLNRANHFFVCSVFLTIGIPTVCRAQHSYLHTTLKSIINNTARDDLERIHIVVGVSYLNRTCAEEVKNIMYGSFDTYLDSGVIELIGIPYGAYPVLKNLRRTYNDEEYRVLWRSKQNIEYAFIMSYSQNTSKYYLQLEDDVTTVPGYLKEIDTFINETKDYWAVLEFSSLGFIGKMFRSTDVHKMATLLRYFYSEQPCDFLLIHYVNLMVQNGRFLKIPTLFQHHGLHSSLPNLLRNVSDKFYAMGIRTLHGDNPEARIYTSLKTYRNNNANNAYDKNVTGYFWALTPKVGDTITIVFTKPQCVRRIAIMSGFPGQHTDRIVGAILEHGNKVIKVAETDILCTGLQYIGEVKEGKIDIRDVTSGCILPESKASCVKLTFTKRHSEWLVINEIAVFTYNK